MGKAQPAVKPVVVPAAENKNCVPVDKDLRYEKLPLSEPQTPAVEPLLPHESEPDIVCEKKDPYKCYYVLKKKENETNAKLEDKKKPLKDEPAKSNNKAEPQYYNPSENSAEFRDLLYKERCFEVPAQ